MVFQSYALYPTMTVGRNLCFGLKVKRRPKAEIDHRVTRAAGLLQLPALLERKPGSFRAASASVLLSAALWCTT